MHICLQTFHYEKVHARKKSIPLSCYAITQGGRFHEQTLRLHRNDRQNCKLQCRGMACLQRRYGNVTALCTFPSTGRAQPRSTYM